MFVADASEESGRAAERSLWKGESAGLGEAIPGSSAGAPGIGISSTSASPVTPPNDRLPRLRRGHEDSCLPASPPRAVKGLKAEESTMRRDVKG